MAQLLGTFLLSFELIHYTQYIEFLTTAVSLSTLWLGIKQNITTWPVSIAITLCNLPLYHEKKLYDKWFTAFISIAFSLYGWYQWKYGGPQRTHLKNITETPLVQKLSILVVSPIFLVTLSQILIYLEASLPYQGALCTFLVVIGCVMTAHKKLETYIIWSILNVISIQVHYTKAYYWFMIKYLIYLFGSLYGYMKWRSIYRKAKLGPVAKSNKN